MRHRLRRWCEALNERGGGGGWQGVRELLHRALARPETRTRADSGDGQPLRAQEQAGKATHSRGGSNALAPFALLAGDESHRRRGLLQGEERVLRKVAARTREALVEAKGRALETITTEDIRGFYTDCGYRLPLQSL